MTTTFCIVLKLSDLPLEPLNTACFRVISNEFDGSVDWGELEHLSSRVKVLGVIGVTLGSLELCSSLEESLIAGSFKLRALLCYITSGRSVAN